MIATTTTRCWGLVLVAGLTLPAPARTAPQAGTAVPVVPGFTAAWRQPETSTGPVALTFLSDLLIVSGPTAPVTARAIADDGRVVWALEHGATAAPAAAADTIYVADGVTVTAHAAATGRAAWSVALKDAVAAMTATADGVLVATVGSDDKTRPPAVYYLDRASGRQRWAQSISRGTPAVLATAGGLAFVTPAAGVVAAWSLETGTEVWQLPVGVEPERLFAADRRLFVSAADEGFFVLRAESGWIEWQMERAKVIGAPGLDADRVYLTFLEHTLIAFDGGGARQWRLPLGGRPMSGPVVAGGSLIVPLTSGAIVAVDKSAGTRIPAAGDEKDRATPDQIWSFAAAADGGVLALVTVTFGERRSLTVLKRQ